MRIPFISLHCRPERSRSAAAPMVGLGLGVGYGDRSMAAMATATAAYGYGGSYYGYGYYGGYELRLRLAYYGWYDDYYYPGTGYLRVRQQSPRDGSWSDRQRAYWTAADPCSAPTSDGTHPDQPDRPAIGAPRTGAASAAAPATASIDAQLSGSERSSRTRHERRAQRKPRPQSRAGDSELRASAAVRRAPPDQDDRGEPSSRSRRPDW